ncbi:MAG: electron transfer flavoprotein-ubiquinone oxidoreductase [Vicinamibacterales bacterium]
MPERETLDVDVLVVGGGPAGLSAALRLSQRCLLAGGSPLSIAVVEKSRDAGAHMLSGAVLDPSTLAELIPDFVAKGAPLAAPVEHDDVYVLTAKRAWRLPIVPPPLRNHGHYIVSLNHLVKWLAQQVEDAGVNLFTGFAASEVLFDGPRVIGVRTGNRGLDKQGQPKPNFEPGVDIRARVTIFCDGVRGNLTKELVRTLGLDRDRAPQRYALGIKELWELPRDRLATGRVVHTLGYPLRMTEFGGAFLYGLPDGLVSIGLVAGLDYQDPMFDPHAAFQRFKQHPFIAALLSDGRMVRYGAKAIPEGGWHAIPRLVMDGGLIAGDAGGMVNSLRLKGIHLAMRSGMLAGDAAFDAIAADDTSAAGLSGYDRAIQASVIRRELYPVRNVHQAFDHGILAGAAVAGWTMLTGGRWLGDPSPSRSGHERMQTIGSYYPDGIPSTGPRPVKTDRQLTFDRLTSVHYSGTRHREDEPSHLIVHDTDICRTRCVVEYGNPCTRFCPASVYEMVDDGAGGKRLQINASNCVHCKACDIMDPYQIVDWTPPEGGEGPQYEGM